MSRSSLRASALRAWLAAAWPPLLVVLLGYAVVTVIVLRAFDYNPSGPIRIGTMLPSEQFWRSDTVVTPGVGYDGQWFFYIAHDPLLRTPDPDTYLDLPAYRYARILYPTLAWALALGQPAAIPWSLLVVNLGAALLGTAAVIDILRMLAASRWLAVGYAFSPPVLIGLSAALAEPTALALVALGVALALRGKHRVAGLVLMLSVLAREPSILVPAAFGLYALARSDWRRGLAYLAPLAVPILWHLSILARLGALPSAQSPTNFGVPFGGAYYRLGLLLGWHPPQLGEPLPSGHVWPEATIILTSCAIVLIGLTKVLERRDVFAWILFLQAALALGTGPLVWADLYSYGRVLGLLYFAFGLGLLTQPHRLTRVPANLAARLADWTISIPAWTKSPQPQGKRVTSVPAGALVSMKRSEQSSWRAEATSSFHRRGGIMFDIVRHYLNLLTLKTGKGQGLVEYALIIVLISVVSIVILGTLGTSVSSVFSTANAALTTAP
jgi:Flp pilus assembly pilin Flp